MSQVVAITRSGEVYSWGLPTDAMGTPSDDLAVPKRLSMLRRQKVLRLECGRRFYCAVVSGVSAGHCVMDGVPSTCAAGTRVKATLKARDMFEEPLTRGGDKFNVSLIHDWDDSVAVKVTVDDNMDGTYDCTFRVAVVGSYTLYVSCGGTYIIGSPFHIDVVSTGVDVDASEVYVMTVDDGWQSVTSAGSPTLPVQAGTPVHFGVELKDSCGNVLRYIALRLWLAAHRRWVVVAITRKPVPQRRVAGTTVWVGTGCVVSQRHRGAGHRW